MKKIFLLIFVFILCISTNAQKTITTLDFNTINLLDPITNESYGSVKNDVKIEFNQTNNSIEIKNYFTHGKMFLDVFDININEEIALFFCYDKERNYVKVFVGDKKVALLSKAIPYTIIYYNE